MLKLFKQTVFSRSSLLIAMTLLFGVNLFSPASPVDDKTRYYSKIQDNLSKKRLDNLSNIGRAFASIFCTKSDGQDDLVVNDEAFAFLNDDGNVTKIVRLLIAETLRTPSQEGSGLVFKVEKQSDVKIQEDEAEAILQGFAGLFADTDAVSLQKKFREKITAADFSQTVQRVLAQAVLKAGPNDDRTEDFFIDWIADKVQSSEDGFPGVVKNNLTLQEGEKFDDRTKDVAVELAGLNHPEGSAVHRVWLPLLAVEHLVSECNGEQVPMIGAEPSEEGDSSLLLPEEESGSDSVGQAEVKYSPPARASESTELDVAGLCSALDSWIAARDKLDVLEEDDENGVADAVKAAAAAAKVPNTSPAQVAKSILKALEEHAKKNPLTTVDSAAVGLFHATSATLCLLDLDKMEKLQKDVTGAQTKYDEEVERQERDVVAAKKQQEEISKDRGKLGFVEDQQKSLALEMNDKYAGVKDAEQDLQKKQEELVQFYRQAIANRTEYTTYVAAKGLWKGNVPPDPQTLISNLRQVEREVAIRIGKKQLYNYLELRDLKVKNYPSYFENIIKYLNPMFKSSCNKERLVGKVKDVIGATPFKTAEELKESREKEVVDLKSELFRVLQVSGQSSIEKKLNILVKQAFDDSVEHSVGTIKGQIKGREVSSKDIKKGWFGDVLAELLIQFAENNNIPFSPEVFEGWCKEWATRWDDREGPAKRKMQLKGVSKQQSLDRVVVSAFDISGDDNQHVRELLQEVLGYYTKPDLEIRDFKIELDDSDFDHDMPPSPRGTNLPDGFSVTGEPFEQLLEQLDEQRSRGFDLKSKLEDLRNVDGQEKARDLIEKMHLDMKLRRITRMILKLAKQSDNQDLEDAIFGLLDQQKADFRFADATQTTPAAELVAQSKFSDPGQQAVVERLQKLTPPLSGVALLLMATADEGRDKVTQNLINDSRSPDPNPNLRYNNLVALHLTNDAAGLKKKRPFGLEELLAKTHDELKDYLREEELPLRARPPAVVTEGPSEGQDSSERFAEVKMRGLGVREKAGRATVVGAEVADFAKLKLTLLRELKDAARAAESS